jgi:hypothetical protein
MPLKRLLELFVGTLSWGFSLVFSGLSTVKHKMSSVGTNHKRMVVNKVQGRLNHKLFGIIYIKTLRANQYLLEPYVVAYVAKVLLCDVS